MAGNLVDRLNGFGFLPERKNYHAVGALIVYLLKHPEVNQINKEFLAGLVVRKGLVRDPAYLAELREQYNIADLPPRDIAPPQVPAAQHPEAKITQPEFEPKILDERGLEKARNSESNLLDFIQLLGAVYSAEAVGRVEFSFLEPLGTGWLIGPDLLLTNQHVLKNRDVAAAAKVRFGHRQDRLGVGAADGQTFDVDPDFYYCSPVEELDYALVRLKKRPLADMMVDDDSKDMPFFELIKERKHRGYLLYTLRDINNLERMHIIQHPGGNPLKAALTQNIVYFVGDMRVQYTTDTLPGSSGSPVFTPLWEVIALHHSGVPNPPNPERPDMNEGIPIKAIINDLEKRKSNDGFPLASYLPKLN